MNDLTGYIVFIIAINVVGIVRLNVFGSHTWQETKKVLVIINIIIVIFIAGYYILRVFRVV